MPDGQFEMDTNKKFPIREYIERAIQGSRFAVLATEGDGQPHASLIAITPVEGFRQLIFATYRSTNKYRNLLHNCKVAVLIEIGDASNSGLDEDFVLTAFGNAVEINIAENEADLIAHLKRHPDLEMFLRSADCSLISVSLVKFQLVHGIDDVRWWSVDDMDAT
jgi:heme iron utilization protein